MKKIVFAIIFIALCSFVFASGKKQEEEKKTINNNWILCITGLNSSALTESRRPIVDVFTRNLVDKIQTVRYRVRLSPEYAYYEDYAWSRDVTAAAKALETKQNERALLLYQGEANWRYRQNLKKKDDEIVKLRETFDRINSEKPLVQRTPDFDITAGNKDRNFPAPPQSGGEYRFCQTQNADAFLTGAISEFYGRYYVTLKLYVQYTRSFIYEDDVIFSAEDIDAAVSEIADKLTMVLAGNKPAAITITAEPPDTLILINQAFAGKGGVETKELPPGKVTVAFSIEDYNSKIIETELSPDEQTEIFVSLSPVEKGEVDVIVPGKPGASIYQGAMYVGEAPLSLWLPINQLDYINILTQRGEESRAVFAAPENVNQGLTLSLKTKLPPQKGERRVNKARSRYYWAWGGTWITGIAAWITYGISTGYNNAYNISGSRELFPKANVMYFVSLGAVGLTGAAVIYEIIRMYWYLHSATEYATPIVKTDSK